MPKDATPPFNAEAEQTIIFRLLLDPRQLALVAGTLQPEHFHTTWAAQAFGAMLALETDRRIIDQVSVEERMGSKLPTLDISRLQRGNLEGYAQIIRRDFLRREAIRQLTKALGVAQQSANEEEVIEAVGEAVQAINSGIDQGALSNPDQAVEAYMGTLKARQAGMSSGLTWGIKALDDRLLPAQRQNMIVVGARPSIGKTALLEFIADHWARLNRGPVLFISLEMSKDELLDRAVSRVSGLNTEALIRGTLTGEEWRLAEESAEKLRKVSIWVYDRGSTTVARIRSELARVSMMAGQPVVACVVDYLGLLKDKAGGDSEYVRISRISASLKAMAKDFNIPVLVAAQFSRKGELRKDPMPMLSDFRDSGAIEQDADIAIGLHRSSKKSKTMNVGILKVRQGGGADTNIRLYFDFEKMTFSSMPDLPSMEGAPLQEPDEDDTWD